MDLIALFRVAERLTLTAVVLLVSVVVMVGFWRSVQKIDLTEGGKTGIAGTFVFSTPVFVLLAIIGYAWVSLEHPITLSPESATPRSNSTVASGSDGSSAAFVGSIELAGVKAEDGHGLAKAIQRVKSLNCMASDRELGNRERDNLDQIKLELLLPFWQPDWGEPEDFSDWATGRSDEKPDPEAEVVWAGTHALC